MNTEQARALVRETFPQTFDKGRFRNFVINLLNHVDQSKAQRWNTPYIKDAFKGDVKGYERLGTYTSPEKDKLDVLIVHLTAESKLERARTAIRNFVADHLKTRDNKDAALVAFVSPTERQWRFSYVKMEYAAVETEAGRVGVETRLTPARRSSYIVGEGESCHTAQTRFLDLLEETENRPTLAQIEDAFSVEAVTKEFFGQYKSLFLDLKDALDDLAKKDKSIGAEFSAKNVSTADFAKKLMGQIVFLYFLQKKGWLGVPKGGDWGDGPHNFLRQLFDGKFRPHKNFFNDILEPLFYDTLATDRGHQAICKTFNCRIPFLNGGLFEPLGDYDWRKTDIIIPNSLFSNTTTTKAGDTGTGILDVFDRYNFTVNEAEPLEKEVAIDPEMLGKVFENLLGVEERKSKGSFYTPREIVHYMCQESLINYLDTAVNKDKELVPRADLELWIHQGDQFAHFAAAIAAGTKGAHYPKPPKPIIDQARLLDDKLADIAVCDPAIGSGAFPVGMMHEIVRARSALTPYFNDVRDRTAYHFKRHAIQNCLYGVDIDPGAVEIAKLRLWLSLVVDEDDPKQIKPLPNLDYKVVVGNSLLGVEKDLFNLKRLKLLEELKPRYFDATDRKQKEKIKREIDDLIHELTNGKEAFDFEIYFSEVMDKKKNGGFDVVIGNPPYLFARNSKQKGITAADKRHYYANFELAEYQVNLYPLFIERGTKVLRPNGCFAFITPNNWLTINTNKLLRKFVLNQSDIVIVNFYARVFESAAVDSSIVIYKNSQQNRSVKLFEYTNRFEFIKQANCDFFLKQREHVINIGTFKDGDTAELIGKIEAQSVILSRIADVKAGLVAYEVGKGSPPQTQAMKESRVYHATRKIDETYIRYLDGKDVCRYRLDWSGQYLKYGDNLAAPRKDFRLYSTKRILVRQIPAKPPYCIHACLVVGTILNDRNSMNIINIQESPECVLGILNSRLISFWFMHKFGKMQRKTFPQFKVNELADFPLPKNRKDRSSEIAKLVDRILVAKQHDAGADVSALEREIDELVYALYGLTPEEIKLVEEGATK